MSLYDEAFRQGADDCQRALAEGSTSLASSAFAPPSEMRDAYEAGWNEASAASSRRLRTKEHWRDVVAYIVGGALISGAAIVLTVLSFRGSDLIVVQIGGILFGLALVFRGLVLLRRGSEPDAA